MSTDLIALAIDGGGTKTSACLVRGRSETDCEVIAEAEAGSSNPAAVGLDTTKLHIQEAAREAIRIAQIEPSQICGAVAGLAGLEATNFKMNLESWLSQELSIDQVNFMTDVELLLFAGQRDLPAIVLISGTGSTAYGRSGSTLARTGGRGYLLGDEGSGFWIGQKGITAAIRCLDHAGPSTRLIELIGAKLSADTADQWTMRVYSAQDPRDLIAQLSREVATAAELHDDVASRILDGAAQELATMVHSVAKQLDVAPHQYDLLFAGGVVSHIDRVRESLILHIQEWLPPHKIQLIKVPALAAARRVLEAASIRVPPSRAIDSNGENRDMP